ncbi:MAG: hypothetical protein SOI44_02890 [Lactimicrobium sp.]|jgi:hypothetical protein|uniref:hypothetical protein n=1 Tax=Lactimicrobium sp. TaxID=2563780 RepID=UPI002F35D60B
MTPFSILLKAQLKNQYNTGKNGSLSGLGAMLVIQALLIFCGLAYGSFMLDDGFPADSLFQLLGGDAILIMLFGVFAFHAIFSHNKDDDMLKALPIKAGTVSAVRWTVFLISQYVYSLAFLITLFLLVNATQNALWYFHLLSILCAICFPLLPSALGALLGYGMKKISLHHQSQQQMENLLNVLLVILLIAGAFLFETISTTRNMDPIVHHILFAVDWMATGIGSQDVSACIAAVLMHAGIFVLVLFPLSRRISRLPLSQEAQHAKSHTEMHVRSSLQALLHLFLHESFRDAGLWFSQHSSLLLMAVMSALLFANKDLLSILPGKDASSVFTNILVILLFFIHAGVEPASAFAKDKDQMWILLSMPIDPSNILFARVLSSIASSIPFSAVCMITLAYRWHLETGMLVMGLLILVISCINTALISLYFFLRYPSFAKGKLNRAVLMAMLVSYAVYILEAVFLVRGQIDLVISISLLALAGMGTLLFTQGRKLFGRIGMRSL